MTTEVFDQEKVESKYELYDVNSLYPEKVDMDDYIDYREQRYGIKFPGLDASDEEKDAYYSEIERQDAEADEAWKNRPAIEKFFYGVGLVIAIPFVAFMFIVFIWEDVKDRIVDFWYNFKDRR
jgi:hypothetical protein